ncbi:hypothetical protein H072_1378 [Dactylellina haptotyla CBS 200.50]|uniref:Translation initiation factor IF-2, mitochondrial n=1 Tax=Dactylellina haptotyla (strain CBS 200.50) TaxID=1284197 RepID=S8CA65_DACHA|nr:hypothetical protein H072_1378 [Dactylellina haptotyla CBS 200.50]
MPLNFFFGRPADNNDDHHLHHRPTNLASQQDAPETIHLRTSPPERTMRTSLAARRPVTSPCLLCTLRAAAATERPPRTALRRRLARRVHSSSNRLAGEQLATRAEPEDNGRYSMPTSQSSPFQGFGSGQSANRAASRWGKKPVVEPPPPAPVGPPEPPKPLIKTQAIQTSIQTPAPAVEPVTPSVDSQAPTASAIHLEDTPKVPLHDAQAQPIHSSVTSSSSSDLSSETITADLCSSEHTQAADSQQMSQPVDTQPRIDSVVEAKINQGLLSSGTRDSTNESISLEATETPLSTEEPLQQSNTSLNVEPEAAKLTTATEVSAQAEVITSSATLNTLSLASTPIETPVTESESRSAPISKSIGDPKDQSAAQASTESSRSFFPSAPTPPAPKPVTFTSRDSPTLGNGHTPPRALSWAERELSTPGTPVPRDPGSLPASSRWSLRGSNATDNAPIVSSVLRGNPQSLRSRVSQEPTRGERMQPLSRIQEIKDTWKTAAQTSASFGAGKGVARWGVAKKSIFATDTNSILDHLSGKQTASRTDTWSRDSTEQDTFADSGRHDGRSFYGFQARGDAALESALPRRDRRDRGGYDPIEEALEEARMMEEGITRTCKKLKKKDRRRGEVESARTATGSSEVTEWDRKLSAKERDKARHARQWATEDDVEEVEVEVESKAERKERKRLEREAKMREQEEEQQNPPILIPEFVSVTTLARLCKVKLDPFIYKMEELGFEETNPDHVLNAEMAGLIAMEYGFEPVVDRSQQRDLFALPVPADKSVLPPRPPVVTIMGHVDHGKTTILDWLRKSSIVDQEHGGITQHIGAFSVNMPSGRVITFLDTPGHEAFLKMRERGANITDIVILVVAADDSIMPQTIEAIKHAKSAGVPIIVAINKCDKEDADPGRVESDLAIHDIQTESVGGDTQVVRVSGRTGLGMEDLEEAVLLQADDIDMRAEKTGRMEGWIVETTTRTKGRVATVLVRRGTLRRGDVIVAGKTWARVRNLITENGVEIPEAPPGTPVEIDGWRDQPDAGDEVLQAESEEKAKSVVEYRLFKEERVQLAKDIEAINERRRLHHEKKQREARLKELQAKGLDAAEAELELPPVEEDDKFKVLEVPFIIKADVAGSVEAVSAQVLSVANEEVRTKIIRSGVGPLSESDIAMAETTGAYCLTFNVNNDSEILAMARYSNINIIEHNVIYAILDNIKTLMAEKLKPTIIRTVVGEAEIAQIFQFNITSRKIRPFAGCRVYRGVVTKGFKAKVLRGGETVYDGEIETLKHIKKDVKEMSQGTECGMGFLDFDDFKEGDIVHCYTETKKKRTFH